MNRPSLTARLDGRRSRISRACWRPGARARPGRSHPAGAEHARLPRLVGAGDEEHPLLAVLESGSVIVTRGTSARCRRSAPRRRALALSETSGLPGNSEALWPSGPRPISARSSRGVAADRLEQVALVRGGGGVRPSESPPPSAAGGAPRAGGRTARSGPSAGWSARRRAAQPLVAQPRQSRRSGPRRDSDQLVRVLGVEPPESASGPRGDATSTSSSATTPPGRRRSGRPSPDQDPPALARGLVGRIAAPGARPRRGSRLAARTRPYRSVQASRARRERAAAGPRSSETGSLEADPIVTPPSPARQRPGGSRRDLAAQHGCEPAAPRTRARPIAARAVPMLRAARTAARRGRVGRWRTATCSIAHAVRIAGGRTRGDHARRTRRAQPGEVAV